MVQQTSKVVHQPIADARLRSERTGALQLTPISSYADYWRYHLRSWFRRRGERRYERSLPGTQPEFTVSGYCYPCGKQRELLVDYNNAYPIGGILTPNWRERLVCPVCGLAARKRAAVQILEQLLGAAQNDAQIYLTEQSTPLYRHLAARYARLVGSEYLPDDVTARSRYPSDWRSEDLTALSFADERFDCVASFDVLEHIADFRAALAECLRVLKPGGLLLFSVPFSVRRRHTLVRATQTASGEITHLLPPEYHRDPLSNASGGASDDQGCLAFYHFGWDLLDELRSIGYCEVAVQRYWSRRYGYLGSQCCVITATKP